MNIHTDFGETNSNGVWVKKINIQELFLWNLWFFLEFKQTGTSENSSGIGVDTSGNDNHYVRQVVWINTCKCRYTNN